MMNEKVKEMGGVPIHGSLFAVEEEDGSMFVVQISGDSGVGKSEMLAAMILKWLKKDLPGIRSIKMIAGDMFFVFPDDQGNLYGIGTEEGDRVREHAHKNNEWYPYSSDIEREVDLSRNSQYIEDGKRSEEKAHKRCKHNFPSSGDLFVYIFPEIKHTYSLVKD